MKGASGMKRRAIMTALAVVLTLCICQPAAAKAATLDINGHTIAADDAGQVLMKNGTTMVSETVLKDAFFLDVTRDGDDYTLTNAYGDFTIHGSIGADSFTMDGDMVVALPEPALQKDDQLYLPLRALAECFGAVHWYGDRGETLVRFDYNDVARLAEAPLSTEPLAGAFVVNGGFGDTDEDMRIITQTHEGVIFEKLNDQGYAVAVGNAGDKNFITVQHENYALHDYDFDDDYCYWWESPLASGETTSYLYFQARSEGAEPQLLAESDFVASHDAGARSMSEWMTAYHSGNLLWAVQDARAENLELWLYESASDRTTRLDCLPADAGMMVALGDDTAVWTTARTVPQSYNEDANGLILDATYGDLKCCDLATGEITNLSQGYNFSGPVIAGDNLIVQTRLQEGEDPAAYESLWVYDLAAQQWRCRVTHASLGIDETNAYITKVRALDDSHVAIFASGFRDPYTLPVLDLTAGSVHKVYSAGSDEYIYCLGSESQAEDLTQGTIYVEDLQIQNKTGENIATVTQLREGEMDQLFWAMDFSW